MSVSSLCTGSKSSLQNRYMRLKKDKLNYQVNITGRPRDVSSAIFKGISIFVNGFTGDATDFSL